jgi:hypothetical protein
MGVPRLTRISVSRLVYASLALFAGCANPSTNQPAPAAAANQETTLEVVNRSSSDMELFMLRMGDRVRLGLAPANVTTKFTLQRAQTAGVGPVTFQARPLLGLARPIQSDPTVMYPGDTITLEIPPP